MGLPAEVAREKIGRYEIIEEIERGDTSTIYKARHPQFTRPVALRVFHSGLGTQSEKSRKCFKREIMFAERLEHPNIVNVYDADEDRGLRFIVSEYLEGHTLAQIMKAEGPLPIERVTTIARQICDALDHAHQQGVVHRNIKPANIVLLKNDRVKVIDFDLAKLISAPDISQPGEFQGTFCYSSPEQIASWPIDGRSDIFSLGIVIYEMLTGERPFQGESIHSLINQILNAPPSLEGLGPHSPTGLKDILLKAIAKDVNKRYQTCAEIAYDLEHLLVSTAELSNADLTWRFFESVGFDIEKISDTVYKIKSGKPEWKEYGEMLVHCFETGDVLGNSIVEVASASLEKAGDGKKMAFIVHSGQLIDGAAKELWKSRMNQDLTIVPMHRSQLQSALDREKSKREACYWDLVTQKRIWGILIDPYDSINSVTDPQWFFGQDREETVQRLLKLIDDGVDRIVVYGMRRIGKTTVLNQLELACRAKGYPVVKFECQRFSPEFSYYDVLSDVIRDWASITETVYPHFELPDSSVRTQRYTANTATRFKKDVMELWEALRSHTQRDLRLVLLMDEVDRIFPKKGSTEEEYRQYCNLTGEIRAALQISGKPGVIAVVAAMESPQIHLVDRFRFDERYSRFENPMYASFETVPIWLMKKQGWAEMVQRIGELGGLEYTTNSLDWLHEETKGHPAITRRLCSCIVDLRDEGEISSHIQVRDVSWAIRRFLQEPSRYSNYLRTTFWENPLSFDIESDKRVMAELATRWGYPKNELLPQLIEQFDRFSLSIGTKVTEAEKRFQVDKLTEATERLIDLSMIVEDKETGEYCITVPLYQRWIRQKVLGIVDDEVRRLAAC